MGGEGCVSPGRWGRPVKGDRTAADNYVISQRLILGPAALRCGAHTQRLGRQALLTFSCSN